jgi:hypothetical protein
MSSDTAASFSGWGQAGVGLPVRLLVRLGVVVELVELALVRKLLGIVRGLG